MKEVTTVVTIQITSITRHKDAHVERFIEENKKEENIREFESDLKEIFENADDVKVTNVQNFIMDDVNNVHNVQNPSWKDSMMQHFTKTE